MGRAVPGVTASRRNEVMEQVIDNWVRLVRQGEYRMFIQDLYV